MIYAFIIRILTYIFVVYGVMASFIAIRDILVKRNSILWVSLLGLAIGILTLLIMPATFSKYVLVFVVLVSLPIFLTDKRRNWDFIDRGFRWVSLIAVIGAAFLTLNYLFFR